MRKSGNIVSATRKEIRELLKTDDQTDWARIDAMTPEEIEANALSDPETAGLEIDWSSAVLIGRRPKAMLSLRIDQDVLKHFRAKGRGYQTTINAILRSYMEHERKIASDTKQAAE